jgi:cobaltochelatase CobS
VTVEPHDGFRLVTASNALGPGDETGLYAGTKVLNAASLDRFAAVFQLSYMPPALEVDVIQGHAPGCGRPLASKLVKAAGDVRKARDNDEVYCTFSTRRLVDIARKHSQMGDLGAALNLALLSTRSPCDRQAILDICQHLGDLMQGAVYGRP